MSINFVRFLQELDIVNEGVQSFVGERCYMATGDLSNEDTNEFELVTYQNKPSRAALTAKSGDVIFARMKGTNKVLLVTEKESNYIFSTGFVVIRSSENVNKSFLTHFLKSNLFQDEKDKLCTGATQKAINNQNIEKLKFPLPPLATQKRIAEILDAADILRRKDQELLKKYDELAQAIFIDMFGDPVKNEKGWDVKKLGNACKVQGGFSFKSSDLKNEGIKLVKIGNVHFENIDWSEVECLPNSFLEKYRDFSLIEDDICIALTRPIIKSIDSVKVVKVNKDDLPCLLNQRVGRFIIDDKKLNSTYLLNFIYSKHFKNIIEKLCSTSLQPNIGTSQIEDIEIPLPPINIQNLFEKRVKSLMKIKKQSSTNESHLLFNSLIQKAFKGELVA